MIRLLSNLTVWSTLKVTISFVPSTEYRCSVFELMRPGNQSEISIQVT